ncbi:DUF5803 family protein [Halobacteriaceae archaeon GCM10025711]
MSRRRLLVGLALLAALVALAGCTGGTVDEQALAENATYDWNTSADATFDVGGDRSYQAVYTVDGQEEIAVYFEDGFTGKQPVPISALKFRYPNGTVANASAMEVSETNDEVVIGLPSDQGQVAYTTRTDTKSFRTPALVNGTYEVVLPPGMRVGVPILSDVKPGGYEAAVEADGRTHVRWDQIEEGDVVVRYYLQRDLYLFGGGIAALALIAVAGLVYFRLQIRRLERQRADAGLDLEESDDSDDSGLL